MIILPTICYGGLIKKLGTSFFRLITVCFDWSRLIRYSYPGQKTTKIRTRTEKKKGINLELNKSIVPRMCTAHSLGTRNSQTARPSYIFRTILTSTIFSRLQTAKSIIRTIFMGFLRSSRYSRATVDGAGSQKTHTGHWPNNGMENNTVDRDAIGTNKMLNEYSYNIPVL